MSPPDLGSVYEHLLGGVVPDNYYGNSSADARLKPLLQLPLGHGVLSVSVHCVEAALGPRPAAPRHPESTSARALGSELQVLARHGCHVDSRPQLPPS